MAARHRLGRIGTAARATKPRDWSMGIARPGDVGWARRIGDIRANDGFNGPVGALRCGGSSLTIFADVPASFVAAGSRVVVFGILGYIRAEILNIPLGVAGAQVLFHGPNAIMCDSLEIEVQDTPVAAPLDQLRLSCINWEYTEGFWDQRFVEILERLEALRKACEK